MKKIAICLLLLSACNNNGYGNNANNGGNRSLIKTGVLENSAIGEASGLARSIRNNNRLWVINDGGSRASLFAIGHDGSDFGEVKFAGMENIDWEDLASFEFEGTPMILIADVGDNLGWRDHVNLYVVEEPDLPQIEGRLAWQIPFRYPDGPRDAEAMAVDPEEGLVYLLSKRTIPAELYSIPLYPADSGETTVSTATYLGAIESLPQPTQTDLERALAEKNWHWQPTAMTFSADGEWAVILTYRAVYLYSRHENESWFSALQHPPQVFALEGIKEAEAATMAGGSIFVTVEAASAPLYRLDFKH